MMNPGAFEDRREMQTRLMAMRVISIFCFILLASAFWILQVVQHDKYGPWADKNYLRTIPLRAPRGVLFDRTGRVLVDNQDSDTITFLRERTANMNEAIRILAEAVGLDEARVREPIQRAIARRDPPFRPIPIIEHATKAQVVAVLARALELPEVVVQHVPARKYPDDRMAAHLFGYVGEIQEPQLGRPEFTGLESGAVVGQSGVERIYNARLQGVDGHRTVVVNSVGREIEYGEEGMISRQDPQEGARMQLTLDYDLQRALEDSFKAMNMNGTGVFLDPGTGEVLALTSLPAFDPNVFAGGMDRTEWSGLQKDPLKPMSNRLIQGTYSPGSTFKIVMAIAALEEGVITPDTKVFCPGHATFYGRQFGCWKKGGHGLMDLRHAIEQSCNVFFYTAGDKLGIDRIFKYANMFGLVGKNGIDLPGEVDSLVPSSEWKQRTFKEKWYAGETISVSIGQGAVAVTPLALATMMATVGNGGTLVTPHLARAFDLGDGKGWQPFVPPAPRSRLSISPEHLQAVRDGLWMVVNQAGTGGRARIAGYDVSGKTGTSQVVSNQNKALATSRGMDTRDHGWFVFFAPRDNPQIAGAILAEHGLHGSEAAAISKHVLETFFAKKEGRPLPVLPKTIITTPVAAPVPGAAPQRNQTREPGTVNPEPRNRR
jgi:penicillin-binding protein 2